MLSNIKIINLHIFHNKGLDINSTSFVFSTTILAHTYPIPRKTMNNIPIYTVNSGYKAIAGPGHNPPIPQPIPNNVDPNTNLRSTVVFVGTSYFVLKTGLSKSLKVIKLIPTAEIKTNAKLAI
jgi:hypothetical protein